MSSFFKALAIVFFVALLPASAKETATSVNHLKSLENDINRNPHPVYLQLKELESHKLEQMSDDAILWLFYRKAQAENLLYFFEEFEKTVAKAAARITKNSDTEVQVAIQYFQGLVALRNGTFDKALTYFNTALEQAKTANLNYLFIVAKNEAAYTQTLRESYQSSLEDMQEAYVEAFAINDYFLIAQINEVYGAIYGYMGDYQKSIEYYQKSLDTYERLGYQPFVAEAIYGLATTYRYWKKFDKAAERFEQYRKKIAYTPNRNISFFGEYGLGMTYAEQGDCLKALPVIDYALTLHGQIDYNAELYKKKALCQIQLTHLDQANISLSMAKEIFAQMPELTGTTWQLEVVKIEGLLAQANGELDKSIKLLLEYYQAYTELLVKNSSDKVIKVREAMDLERLDIEISALKQKEQYQQLLMLQKEQEVREHIGIVIASLVVLLLVSVILVLQYRNNRKIFALSITDPLTKVFNRRYVFEYLDKLVKNTASRDGELSVILFDIDDFKQINDQFGHPFGDEVLLKVVELTQITLRTGDILGRIGGEEFMCILPRTDSKQAKQVAERLCKSVRIGQFKTPNNKPFQVTVSIGITSFSEQANDRASLYVQSDKALYQAKQRGKNQVVIYSDESR